MYWNPINRRHFLQGSGSFALSLPFLSSLLPSTALAQQQTRPKYFFAIQNEHGGVNHSSFFPQPTPSAKVTEVQLYAGDAAQGMDHKIRHSRLQQHLRSVTTLDGTQETALSPVMGAFMNPYLNKMNALMGLDMVWGGGHQWQAILGNAWGTSDSPAQLAHFSFPAMPTIDQVMANSTSFYPLGDPRTEKSIALNQDFRVISAEMNGGKVQDSVAQEGLDGLYNRLFGNSGATTTLQTEPVDVINKVLADYNRLTSGAFGASRRISADDRARLNEFVSQLDELGTRIRNLSGSACPLVSRPGTNTTIWTSLGLAEQIRRITLFLDMLMAGFRCGRTRIGTLGLGPMAGYTGNDWHQDIAHRHDSRTDPEPQRWLIKDNRTVMKTVFTKVMESLDVDMGLGDGTTYLDQAVVMFSTESGERTHYGNSIAHIIAGGAGGAIKTGYYVDYRNMSNLGYIGQWDLDVTSIYPPNQRPGLPTNRFLGTMLQAMGIQPSEYARPGMRGYGDSSQRQGQEIGFHSGHVSMPPRVINDCDIPLPIIS